MKFTILSKIWLAFALSPVVIIVGLQFYRLYHLINKGYPLHQSYVEAIDGSCVALITLAFFSGLVLFINDKIMKETAVEPGRSPLMDLKWREATLEERALSGRDPEAMREYMEQRWPAHGADKGGRP